MQNLKAKVIDILTKYPETRNSDIKLSNRIWFSYYREQLFEDANGDFCVRLRDMYNLPKEDNIKRIRALLNSKGKFLPDDPNVRRARKINEEKWTDFLRQETHSEYANQNS